NTYIASSGNQSKTIEMTSISYSDRVMPENGGGRDEGSGKPPSDMPKMDDNGGMREPRERNSDTDFK
ncbi:MAG: hypothetical protein K2G65_01995, partial [Eubacterium sp.]|nr:hypothetical protein [Eubacterium sp.]